MTIKIERDAFLRVITRKGPLIEKQQQQPEEDEFVVVSLPSKDPHGFFYDDSIPASTEIDDDDDQASLLSLSTDSTTSSTSTLDDDQQRRVSFAPELVTDVFTREKTLPEDVSNLYYTSMETQTFRQQYRFERKVINELSIDPESFPDEELDNLLAKAAVSPTSTATNNLGSPACASRHHISRVVVLHNDKLETFFNQEEPQDDDDGDDCINNQGDDLLSSLVGTPSSTMEQPSPSIVGSTLPTSSTSSDDFFDSDSFWTGSLTWY